MKNHIYSNNELYFQNPSRSTMADETYEEDRKLFVGGLPQECSQDDLKVRLREGILNGTLIF